MSINFSLFPPIIFQQIAKSEPYRVLDIQTGHKGFLVTSYIWWHCGKFIYNQILDLSLH